MSLVRVLRTALVTLSHTFEVDEVRTDAVGAVTVDLKRLDGTALVTGATATHAELGVYTYQVPAQPNVDALTLDWSGLVGGATVVARDYIEVVGGFLFGLSEARAAHKTLRDRNAFPTSMLAAKRIAIEDEAELVAGGRSFVPRFSRVQLSGTGDSYLLAPNLDLRVLRAVTIGGAVLDAGQLAGITALPSGALYRPGGWPWGVGNIIVEYEYGLAFPPTGVRDAGILRLRSMSSATNTQIPDKAVSFTTTDGGTYRIAAPGPYSTGIPDVDAAYLRAGYDGPV